MTTFYFDNYFTEAHHQKLINHSISCLIFKNSTFQKFLNFKILYCWFVTSFVLLLRFQVPYFWERWFSLKNNLCLTSPQFLALKKSVISSSWRCVGFSHFNKQLYIRFTTINIFFITSNYTTNSDTVYRNQKLHF